MNIRRKSINYLMGDIKMDRKKFMEELSFLLSDINDDERREALLFYENYFDEAGKENEEKVICELGDPSRVAAMIKDGLSGQFDDHISSGNQGFSNDDYQMYHEVSHSQETSFLHSIKNKWNQLESRDKVILIILGVIALVPFSASVLSVFFNTIGGLFGVGFSIVGAFIGLIFGFWIITFILYAGGIALIVIGVLRLFSIVGLGLIEIGAGCLLLALGQVFSKLAIWFFKDCIPMIIEKIGRLFHRGGETV